MRIKSDHLQEGVSKIFHGRGNRLWSLFSLEPLTPLTSVVTKKQRFIYHLWHPGCARVPSTQTTGGKMWDEKMNFFFFLLFVGDFIVTWHVFSPKGQFTTQEKELATFHPKMRKPLLVRKCKVDTIVFHQSWLLVQIRKDLLGTGVTVAEKHVVL